MPPGPFFPPGPGQSSPAEPQGRGGTARCWSDAALWWATSACAGCCLGLQPAPSFLSSFFLSFFFFFLRGWGAWESACLGGDNLFLVFYQVKQCLC